VKNGEKDSPFLIREDRENRCKLQALAESRRGTGSFTIEKSAITQAVQP